MNTQRGFTLIEILIYLGLFALIMVGILASAFSIFQGSGRTQTKVMVQEEGDFLLGKIGWVMTGGSNITQPTFGNSDNTLSLTKAGTVYNLVLSGGNLSLQGATLNNTNITVLAPTAPPTFVFSHTGTGTNPEFITARFTLQAKTPSGQVYSQDFTTTKYLRK